FDTANTVHSSVRLMAAMLDNTSVNEKSCNAAANDAALLATDLADYLVRKGMPFRQAHHVVGAVVAAAERGGKQLNQLDVSSLKQIDSHFDKDVTSIFDLKSAMARRELTGAPGTKQVTKQLAR